MNGVVPERLRVFEVARSAGNAIEGLAVELPTQWARTHAHVEVELTRHDDELGWHARLVGDEKASGMTPEELCLRVSVSCSIAGCAKFGLGWWLRRTHATMGAAAESGSAGSGGSVGCRRCAVLGRVRR